jgi:uncharacterized protein YbjT (DUF2867 family)
VLVARIARVTLHPHPGELVLAYCVRQLRIATLAVRGVPMLDSKHRIEYHLATLPVPHPVIASVYFMDNLAYPWNTAVLQAGQWPGPLPPDRTVQLIPAVDWRASALVVERPGDFADRRVELMGCQKSGCPVSRRR